MHPQWMAKCGAGTLQQMIRRIEPNDTVLDIGCFDKWPKDLMPSTCTYIGLDYLATAQDWYHSTPDIFGDASKLPVASESIDTVLLLDVLEHIPDAHSAMQEIRRVLKPDGKLIVQMPFIYPLHDEPRDYLRLTRYGFEQLAHSYGFVVEEMHEKGHPMETAVLLSNIAATKTVANCLSGKSLASVIALLLPVYIFLNNLLGKLLSKVSPADSMMPFSYQLVLKKVSDPAATAVD